MSLAARVVALVPTRSRAARLNATRHRRDIVVMASATSTDASFVGRWTRDGSRSVNAEAYLASHGLDVAKAAERAAAPYEQEWRETGAEEGEFLVLTDPGTGRGVRSLVYPIGEWEEEFKGSSELFGAEPGVVYRNTTYNEIPHFGPVHLTESATPLGWETTQRTLSKDGNEMVVDRSFTPRMPDGSAGEKISSKEYFTRVMVFRPLDAS